MRPRRSSTDSPAPTWPADDPFERLDVETWFKCGTAMIGSAALPQGWTEARLEELWRARGAEIKRERWKQPDLELEETYAWDQWGPPGGG